MPPSLTANPACPESCTPELFSNLLLEHRSDILPHVDACRSVQDKTNEKIISTTLEIEFLVVWCSDFKSPPPLKNGVAPSICCFAGLDPIRLVFERVSTRTLCTIGRLLLVRQPHRCVQKEHHDRGPSAFSGEAARNRSPPSGSMWLLMPRRGKENPEKRELAQTFLYSARASVV